MNKEITITEERASLSEVANEYSKLSVDNINAEDIALSLIKRFQSGQFNFYESSFFRHTKNSVINFSSGDLEDYIYKFSVPIFEICLENSINNTNIKPDYEAVFNKAEEKHSDTCIGSEYIELEAELLLKEYLSKTSEEIDYNNISEEYTSWLNKLPGEYNKLLIHNDEVIKSIHAPENIFRLILRRAKLYSGEACRESRMVNRDLPILLENNDRSIKDIYDDTQAKMNLELKKLLLALSKRVIITKNTFHSWIRSNKSSNDNFMQLPENPTFWGDAYTNHPISQETNNEDAKEYNLYDAISYWSAPEDIAELRINQYKVYGVEKELTFQLLEQTNSFFGVEPYNNSVKEIHKNFLCYFKNNRLEMYGKKKGESGLKKISIEDIGAFISSSSFNWENNSVNDSEYIGIRVFKNIDSKKLKAEYALKAWLSEYSTKNNNPVIKKECAIMGFETDNPAYRGVFSKDSQAFCRRWKDFPNNLKLKGAPKGKRKTTKQA